jgi:5'-nucleotidase
VPEIKAHGVRAIVLLIHQGGVPKGEVNAATCEGVEGEIFPILDKLDPEFDVVVTGHTHQAYVCRYKGRLVTQASSYGRLITAIDLAIDPGTGDVVESRARNEFVDPAQPSRDAAYAALIADAKARTDAIAARPIARLGVDQIKRFRDPGGDSALGRFVADAQLEAGRAQGVVIACMNPGGVRQNLPAVPRPDRSLDYADIQAVHPFGNRLIVLELTGAEIAGVLESQLARVGGEGLLSCSRGFTYRYDKRREAGHRLLPGYPWLDGKPLEPGRTYRVLVNNYIAGGGDGLLQLKDKKQLLDLGTDLDALSAYLKAHEPATPPEDMRVEGKFEGD